MAGIIAPMTPATSPRMPPYTDALTGLRGIAALWVLVFHLWQRTGAPALALGPLDLTPLAAHGYLGVDLFFVLSGYLIGGPWVAARLGGAKVAFGKFWWRRLLRVFPAYWAQWAVLALLAASGPGGFPMGAGEALLSLSLTANLIDNATSLNPVWWSLPVEWDFYLVAPLVALAFTARRPLPRGLLLIVLACVGFRLLVWWMVFDQGLQWLPLYRWVIQLPGRLDQFALGMLVAHALMLGRGGSERRLALAGTLATLVLVWLLPRKGYVVDQALAPWLYFQFTVFGCAFAALLGAAAMSRTGLMRALLANRPLVFIGTISYSLYLWHYPVLEWLSRHAKASGASTASWRWAALAVAASVLVSAISYVLTERPFLRHRRAGAGRGQSASPMPDQPSGSSASQSRGRR